MQATETQEDLNLVEASIDELRTALSSGSLTSVELVAKYLRRIARYDYRGPSFNAIPILSHKVFEDAAASDDRRAAGLPLRPFEGIPYTAKDSYKVRDMTVASGSPAFKDLISSEDAFIVARLRDAGAVLVGKTNMPPMASGGVQRGVYGRAESPYNLEYLTAAFASGSSNGSATSTAASFSAFGLAGETVSSGRSPASNNGLIAYTPSRGVISTRGSWPLYPTCDVVVPHTRTMSDMLELLDVLVTPDESTEGDFWRQQKFVEIPHVSTLRPASYSELRKPLSLQGKRVGVPRMYIGIDEPGSQSVETRKSVLDLWKRARLELESLGATVVETDFPVVTNYEKQDFPGQSVNVPGLPPKWNDVERGTMIAYAWDDFLRQNRDIHCSSLETAIGDLINPAKDPNDPQVKYAEPQNGIKYHKLADFTRHRTSVGAIESLQHIPGLCEALQALEATRKRDFEDWLSLHSLDIVAFPANGDVGRADADINDKSAKHAWTNGVKYSNGNRALRHLGIPTVTVTMGRLEDLGMPVGLTFAGRAYTDNELLQYAYAYERHSLRREAPPLAPPLDTDAIPLARLPRHTIPRKVKRPVINVDYATRSPGSDVHDSHVSLEVRGSISYVAGADIKSVQASIDGEDAKVQFISTDCTWNIKASVIAPRIPQWEGRMYEVPLAMESIMVVVLVETNEGCISGRLILV